jgi:hypothetical protein
MDGGNASFHFCAFVDSSYSYLNSPFQKRQQTWRTLDGRPGEKGFKRRQPDPRRPVSGRQAPERPECSGIWRGWRASCRPFANPPGTPDRTSRQQVGTSSRCKPAPSAIEGRKTLAWDRDNGPNMDFVGEASPPRTTLTARSGIPSPPCRDPAPFCVFAREIFPSGSFSAGSTRCDEKPTGCGGCNGFDSLPAYEIDDELNETVYYSIATREAGWLTSHQG